MVRMRQISILIVLLAFGVCALSAQTTVDTVGPGMVHLEMTRTEGPWRIHALRVDLAACDCRVLAARPYNALQGRERVSDMAGDLARHGVHVIAGINGDFFDLRTGENENNQIIDGKLWKGVPVSDSPFDTFRNAHSHFAVGVNGRPYFERFSFSGTLTRGHSTFVLDGLNGVPRIERVGLVLFNEDRSGANRGDSIPGALQVTLQRLPSDRYRVVGNSQPLGKDAIMKGSARLVAYGAAAQARLDSLLLRNGILTLRYQLLPDRAPLAQVVGGWPRVVQDGANIGARTDSIEGTFPRFSAGRHARAAVAITRDSATLLLVTVDGIGGGVRPTGNEPSVGMSLAEWADQLIALGAYQALNLDGGGSSTLLVRDKLVNVPSDRTGERAVGISLFVIRPSAGSPARR
jgi:hypothetical protein